jgi:hypothetical protein
MSEYVIILKFFKMFLLLRALHFLPTPLEDNAVKHFPFMSSTMSRLESNVCFFFLQVIHVKVS